MTEVSETASGGLHSQWTCCSESQLSLELWLSGSGAHAGKMSLSLAFVSQPGSGLPPVIVTLNFKSTLLSWYCYFK